MNRRSIPIMLTALALVIAMPSGAVASPAQIYDDCQDGRLDRGYSGKDLREALADMPKDLDEYTSCREIIRSAQQGARGPGGAGPSNEPGRSGYGPALMGDGGLPVGGDKRQVDPMGFMNDQERAEIERARAGASTGGERAGVAVPTAAGTAPGAPSDTTLPTPVVALLILIATALLATIGSRLKDLVVRRSA